MKRILALLLAGALLCTLTGCSTAADGQAVLKFLVNEFDGPLQFVVGQGHPVTGRNGEFTHIDIQSFI